MNSISKKVIIKRKSYLQGYPKIRKSKFKGEKVMVRVLKINLKSKLIIQEQRQN